MTFLLFFRFFISLSFSLQLYMIKFYINEEDIFRQKYILMHTSSTKNLFFIFLFHANY